MKVDEIKQFLSFQAKALDGLEFLIKYDREQAIKNNQPAEKTVVLKAFIDTQRRSLDVATLLLQKHESTLKQEEEAKIKAEKEHRATGQSEKDKGHINNMQTLSNSHVENSEVDLFNALQDGEEQ